MTTSLTIDCDDCAARGTAQCDDCIVTYLCDREPLNAIIIDADEVRAVRMLSRAGLAPRLRHSLVAVGDHPWPRDP